MNILENCIITAEQAKHSQIVEQLAERAFGPGRFTRTAFRLREQVPHEPHLSFVCWVGGEIIASVRLTKVFIGEVEALLLGPLVVAPEFKGRGYGGELMRKAVDAARKDDHSAIVLVGDLSYYQKFGFEQIPAGKVSLPGPVDPARLLICELNPEKCSALAGAARRFSG